MCVRLDGDHSVVIVLPDEVGNVSFASGWAHSDMTTSSGQYLLITSNASGVAGQLLVVGSTASPLGRTTYNNELLDGFMAVVTFA